MDYDVGYDAAVKGTSVVVIPNHHKRKHGSNMAKKNKGSNAAKNQKLNIEDHIASTPIGPRKKTYPHVGS